MRWEYFSFQLICLSKEETGTAVGVKLDRVRAELKKKQCTALVLLSLDDIMCMMNDNLEIMIFLKK